MVKLRNTLYKAAHEAGDILKENFTKTFEIKSKDHIANLVTAIDHQSEQKIMEVIKTDFPEHDILTEESGFFDKKSEYKWIIDPIDGTVNYAHGIPLTCVSIGIEHKGEIILGAVYNPMMNEYFFAEKGSGAYLNDIKIEVSKESNFGKALLVTGFPYNSSENKNNPAEIFTDIVYKNIPVRRLGSAAIDLCWTACGRFEGFWEFDLNPWDIAAGCLIMEEAGGKLTNFNNEKLDIYGKEILATNGLIHKELLEVVSNRAFGEKK